MEDTRYRTPRGEWLSNTYDPARSDAKMHMALSFEDWAQSGGRERAWASHLAWINANVIGPPMPSTTYTCDELERMGMVGVYRKAL